MRQAMDRVNEFAERLTKLRLEKQVSAREMSLALGQNASYINRIENGKTLPSMQVFFEICDYLCISPMDFFNQNLNNVGRQKELVTEVQKLSPDMAEHFLNIIKSVNK